MACESHPIWPPTPASERESVVRINLQRANIERRRAAEARDELRPRYKIRAGIEATNSELKRGHGLRKLRVRGKARVQLAVHFKALACNVKRMLKVLVQRATVTAQFAASAA